MSVTATYDIKVIADEQVTLGLTDADDPIISHDIGSHRATINGSSTVDVTKAWSYTGNLAGGTATIDLTALTMSNLPDVTLTGLKIKLWKIEVPAANTLGVVVDVGAANGYELFGDANAQLTFLPGQVMAGYLAEEAATVAAADKTIDLSSADVDAAYSIMLIAGSA